MKKNTKHMLMIAAILLTLGGSYCAFILPLNGSILHKALLTQKMRDYVAETYGPGYTVERAVYNFKMNNYICYVQSDASVDTRFSIYENKDGELTDHYDFEVGQKETTIGRLSRELEQRMERDFVPVYPWECVNYMCSFEKEPLDRETPEVRERFVLDMPLDMQDPPVPLDLTLWVVCDDPSWETLAESLKEAVKTADYLGWNVSLYSITLHTPFAGDDEKPINTATDFCVYDLPREIIAGDALMDYLIEALNIKE